MTKTIIAKASFVNTSPRKLRLVADAVRPLTPLKAITYLQTLPQRASKVLLKVYRQALGNAKQAQASLVELVTESLQITEGPRYKRRDRSHGARYDSGIRKKKLSHINLVLKYGAEN